jgi:hypothetical protein
MQEELDRDQKWIKELTKELDQKTDELNALRKEAEQTAVGTAACVVHLTSSQFVRVLWIGQAQGGG